MNKYDKFVILRNILFAILAGLVLVTGAHNIFGLFGEKENKVVTPPPVPYTGILITDYAGTSSIHSEMSIVDIKQMGEATYYMSKVNGSNVIVAHCKQGKVASAVVSSLMLNSFNITRIILISAGSTISEEVSMGTIIIPTDIFQFDYGMYDDAKFIWSINSGIKFKEGKILTDDKLRDLIYKRLTKMHPKVLMGPVVTGDSIIDDIPFAKDLKTRFDAIAADRESAAVGLVAHRFNVPFVSIIIVASSPYYEAILPNVKEADLSYRDKLVAEIIMEILRKEEEKK